MILTIFITSFIGLLLSLYAFFIEWNIKRNPEYKPACDISSAVSCSKPMLSKYGMLFGISNAIVGILFYITLMILSVMNQVIALLLLSTIACFVSLGLAYILYFRIKSFCLICNALYLINFLLLILSINELRGA